LSERKSPTSISPRDLELRDELKQVDAKIKKLDDAERRNLPLLQALRVEDIEKYRRHLQECKDSLRRELLLETTRREVVELQQMDDPDCAGLDLARKRKVSLEDGQERWMESQPKSWHKQELDVLCLRVEAWLAGDEHASSSAAADDESVPPATPPDQITALKKQIYANPDGQTPRRDVARYYGQKESTIGKWVRGEVKSRRLHEGPKKGYVSNQSIIALDERLAGCRE
jgi:hypothetical protein